MSEKNEAIARKLMDDVWSKGNLKLLDEFLSPDYVDHDPVNETRGIEGAKGLVRKYRSAFPDCRLEIDEILSIGDRVITRWHYSGTHQNTFEGVAPTGRYATGTGISIHRFVNGRLVESFTNWDALGLLQQLGIVTMPGKTARAGA